MRAFRCLVYLCCALFSEVITQATITLPFRLRYFTSCDTAAPNSFQFSLNSNYAYLSFFIRVRYPGALTTGLCNNNAVKFDDTSGAITLFSIDAFLEKLTVNHFDGSPGTQNPSGALYSKNTWYFVQIYLDSSSPEVNFYYNITDPNFRQSAGYTNPSTLYTVAPKNFLLSFGNMNSLAFCCFEIADLNLGDWQFNLVNLKGLWALPSYFAAMGIDLTFRNQLTFNTTFFADEANTNLGVYKFSSNKQVDTLYSKSVKGDYMIYTNKDYSSQLNFSFPSLTYPPNGLELTAKTFTCELFMRFVSLKPAVSTTLFGFGPLRVMINSASPRRYLINGVALSTISVVMNKWIRLTLSYTMSGTNRECQKAMVVFRSLDIQAGTPLSSFVDFVLCQPFIDGLVIGAVDGTSPEAIYKFASFSTSPITTDGILFSTVASSGENYAVNNKLLNMYGFYLQPPKTFNFFDKDVKLTRTIPLIQNCYIGITENKTIFSVGTDLVFVCPFLTDSTCQACHTDCLSCSGPKDNECCSCRDGYTMVDGKCLRQCNKDQYTLDNTNCLPCSPFCETCNGPTDKECLSCDTTKYLKSGSSCIRICSEKGTFVANQICTRCHDSCKSCDGATDQDCLSCNLGYNFLTGANSPQFCKGKCCRRCPNNCRRCSLEGDCLECNPTFTLTPSRRCTYINLANQVNFLNIPTFYYSAYPPSINILFDRRFDNIQLKGTYYYLMSKLRSDLVTLEPVWEQATDRLTINLIFTQTSVSNASIALTFVDLLVEDTKGDSWMLRSRTVEFKQIDFYEVPKMQSALSTVGDILFYWTCATLVISAIAINPEGFFINMRMQQTLELLLMLNIGKPANLLALVENFQVSLVAKLYNPFKKIIITDCGLPGTFSQKGLGCLILDNIGGFCFWFIVFIVIMNIVHIVHRLVVKPDKNAVPASQRTGRTEVSLEVVPGTDPAPAPAPTPPVSKLVAVITFVKENLEWPSLMNFFFCFFIDLTLHSLLQVINARKAPNYFAFNSIFGIILFFLCAFYVVANYLLVNAFASEREVFLENKAYFLLFIATDKPKRLQKFYTSFLFAKYFILISLVVLLNDFEFVHCLLFLIVQALFVFRWMLPPPYTARDRNVREFVHEVFLLATAIIIFLGTSLLRVFSNQLTRYTILGSISCSLIACYITWTNVVALSMVYQQHFKKYVTAYLEKKKAQKEALEAAKLAGADKDPSVLENLNQTHPLNGSIAAGLGGQDASEASSPNKTVAKVNRKHVGSKSSLKTSVVNLPLSLEQKGQPPADPAQKDPPRPKKTVSRRGSALSAQLNQSVLTDASGLGDDKPKRTKISPSKSGSKQSSKVAAPDPN